MRAYELMPIIFESDLEDDAVQDQLKKVTDLIEAGAAPSPPPTCGASVGFAYEINHKREGIYVVLEITTEAPNLDDVDRALRLADEVVRHKIIRLPDREATRRGLLGEAPPAAVTAEATPADAG